MLHWRHCNQEPECGMWTGKETIQLIFKLTKHETIQLNFKLTKLELNYQCSLEYTKLTKHKDN